MTRQNDLRVQRTHKLIIDALIDLTVENGFASITVRDIAKRAGINRATFYRHYQDKFDLLDHYSQALYDLLDTPEDASMMIPDSHGSSGLVRMLNHIAANASFFRVMLGKNGDPAFVEKVRQYIEKRMRRSLPDPQHGDKGFRELYLSYLSSGSVGAVLWWLEHDMPYTAEELASISFRLSAAHLEALSEAS